MKKSMFRIDRNKEKILWFPTNSSRSNPYFRQKTSYSILNRRPAPICAQSAFNYKKQRDILYNFDKKRGALRPAALLKVGTYFAILQEQ